MSKDLSQNQKRPIAVTLLTWLLMIGALVNIAAGAVNIAISDYLRPGQTLQALEEDLGNTILFDKGDLFALGGFTLAVGLVQLMIAIGFWRQRRWAWVAAISWQALKLLTDIAIALAGRVEAVPLLISILLIFLLNQSDVRRVFGIRLHQDESAAIPSLNSLDSH